MGRRTRSFVKEKILKVIQVTYNDSGKQVKHFCHAEPDAERKCQYFQDSLNTGNFKRHIITHHRAVAARLDLITISDDVLNEGEPETKKSRFNKICVETNRKQVLQGTLELSTCHNLPISYPQWKGMQHLVEPLWKAAGIDLSRYTLSNLLTRGASLGKTKIKEEMTSKIVHLKVDLASRAGRHAFGINGQFMSDDDTIQIRNLALHEMVERATKENIEHVIRKVLEEYGLTSKQVLSITHDNGSNLVASVKLMKRLIHLKEELPGEQFGYLKNELDLLNTYFKDDQTTIDFSADCEETTEDRCDTTDEQICDDFDDGKLGSADIDNEVHEDEDSLKVDLLESTRCAVHTAQLAVWDVLKSYKSRLASINKVGIQMRHKAHWQLFSLQKVPLPPKVVETRWNVWYLLLKYFKELKEHPLIQMLKTQDSAIDFSKHWNFIEKFSEAFQPTFVLTLKLQKDHVALSQFYADWLICQAQLNGIAAQNNLAMKLLKAMKIRMKMLSDTSIFKACLYLDPRFNFAGSGRLSAEDKIEAQKYFLALDKRLNEISGIDSSDMNEHMGTVSTDDSIEKYLSIFFNEEQSESIITQSINDSLIVEITKLETREKVSITESTSFVPQASTSKSTHVGVIHTATFDIVDYWRKRRFTSPRVYRLAKSVLSAPSTQASVERLFSHFKNVLTDHRMRLAGETLKDIMILKMNDNLLPKIAEELEVDLIKNINCESEIKK